MFFCQGNLGGNYSLFKLRIKLDGFIINLWLDGYKVKFSAQLTPLWHVALISTF